MATREIRCSRGCWQREEPVQPRPKKITVSIPARCERCDGKIEELVGGVWRQSELLVGTDD